jgi:hypothetical protein
MHGKTVTKSVTTKIAAGFLCRIIWLSMIFMLYMGGRVFY